MTHALSTKFPQFSQSNFCLLLWNSKFSHHPWGAGSQEQLTQSFLHPGAGFGGNSTGFQAYSSAFLFHTNTVTIHSHLFITILIWHYRYGLILQGWMNAWALLDLTSLLTSRKSCSSFHFHPCCEKQKSSKTVLPLSLTPITEHTGEFWGCTLLFTAYGSLKASGMFFPFLHPQLRGSQYPSISLTYPLFPQWNDSFESRIFLQTRSCKRGMLFM